MILDGRSSGWQVSLVPSVIVAFICAVSDASGDVREEIASIWSGFDSIECRLIDRVDSSKVGVDSVTTIDFVWKMDGRSSLSWIQEGAGGKSWGDIRENGKRRMTVQYFPVQHEAINRVLVDVVLNRPGHYRGTLFPGLTLFMPGGRTVSGLIDDGAMLENRGSQRVPRWVLATKTKKGSIECILDESHQYLPKEMRIDDERGQQIYKAKEFERDNEFWYPSKGSCVCTYTNGDPQALLTFELSGAKINRSIEVTKFNMRNLPDGTDIINSIDRTAISVGGRLSRLKWIRENQPPKRDAPAGDPIQVPADPNYAVRRWINILPISIAILAGVLGVYFRRRGT